MQEQPDKTHNSNNAIDLKKILQDLHLVSEDGTLIEKKSGQVSTSPERKTERRNNHKSLHAWKPMASAVGGNACLPSGSPSFYQITSCFGNKR